MTMAQRLVECGRLDAAARLRAYAGDVLVLRGLPSALELCRVFKSLRRGTDFDCDASETAFEERERLCRAFERDDGVARLFRGVFDEAGMDGTSTYWDRPRLRVQQSGSGVDDVSNSKLFGTGKYSSTLPPHRDTWASNTMQQLNWWMPLDAIDEGRTMCFFPDLFDRPVPNTSRGWDFEELRSKRREGLPYPQLPELDRDAIDRDKGMAKLLSPSRARPLLVDPGDVVVFSGAHLHSSVVNTTGKTRYSCEIRSVDAGDLREGAGAPNVDGEACRVPLHWFSNVDTNEKLGPL